MEYLRRVDTGSDETPAARLCVRFFFLTSSASSPVNRA